MHLSEITQSSTEEIRLHNIWHIVPKIQAVVEQTRLQDSPSFLY